MKTALPIGSEVTSSILLNLSKGMLLPVGIEMLGHAIHDPFGRFGVREDPHRPRPAPDFAERPLQDVGSADRLPEILWEAEVVETMEQVLLRTADRRFRVVEPLAAPGLESPDRLGPGGRAEDPLRLAHAGLALGPLQLHHDVAQLVGDAPLNAPQRVDLPERFEERRVPVHRNELQRLALQAPALEIDQEAVPAWGILHVRQPEREEFLRSVGVDPEGAEHDLALDAELADLLRDPVQEQEHHVISQRLRLVHLQVGIEDRCRLRDGRGTHRRPEEVPGNPLELPRADPLEEELADRRIHRRLTPLVLVEECEVDPTLQDPRDAELQQGAVRCHQVTGVVAVPVATAVVDTLVPGAAPTYAVRSSSKSPSSRARSPRSRRVETSAHTAPLAHPSSLPVHSAPMGVASQLSSWGCSSSARVVSPLPCKDTPPSIFNRELYVTTGAKSGTH